MCKRNDVSGPPIERIIEYWNGLCKPAKLRGGRWQGGLKRYTIISKAKIARLLRIIDELVIKEHYRQSSQLTNNFFWYDNDSHNLSAIISLELL